MTITEGLVLLLLLLVSPLVDAEFPGTIFPSGAGRQFGARLIPRSYSVHNSYPAVPYGARFGGVVGTYGAGGAYVNGGFNINGNYNSIGGYNNVGGGYNNIGSGYSTGSGYGNYLGSGGTVASSEYSVNTANSALRAKNVHASAPTGSYESNHLGDDYGSDDSNFQYRYMVSDPLTGDAKSQHETRRGDAVTGEYRVLEANGLMRVVSYTADDAHGFVAHVRWEPAERPHGPAVSHQEVSQQHSH